jgi:hypothetical protein
MRIRTALAALLAAALLIATGCLEIVGQRITLRYDAAKDELHFLIHYDGIYDNGANNFGKGDEQVAKAVADGELMLFDWPFHLKPREIAAAAERGDGDLPQEVRDLARALGQQVKVRSVGHFRDSEGRIGGLQHVVITDAKRFLARCNAAINAMIARDANPGGPEMARTVALIKAAAGRNHEWIAIDGSAMKLSVPVHPGEWARAKAVGMAKLIEHVAQQLGGDDEQTRQKRLKESLMVVRALTSVPISYSDAGGMVTLRLGDPAKPSTVRIEMPREYKPNLEDAVARAAPVSIDEVLGRQQLGVKPQKDADTFEALAQWGPPEDKARSLMWIATGKDAALAAKAVKALEALGQEWNKTNGVPRAPDAGDKTDEFLDAWAKWYGQMLRYPLDESMLKELRQNSAEPPRAEPSVEPPM